MPKQKITKEMVVETAFELARKESIERITVKDIAEKLNCSVQPIYSYCQSMDGLRNDIVQRTSIFIQKYMSEHIDKNDFFRSTGYAYVQLAKEEPNIFHIFILHQRDNIGSLEDLYKSETNPNVAEFIAKDLNISIEKAKQLHMNMLIYTTGIGTILATTNPGIPTEEIHKQLENAYQSFLKQATE